MPKGCCNDLNGTWHHHIASTLICYFYVIMILSFPRGAKGRTEKYIFLKVLDLISYPKVQNQTELPKVPVNLWKYFQIIFHSCIDKKVTTCITKRKRTISKLRELIILLVASLYKQYLLPFTNAGQEHHMECAYLKLWEEAMVYIWDLNTDSPSQIKLYSLYNQQN